jgi:hypothetical protein
MWLLFRTHLTPERTVANDISSAVRCLNRYGGKSDSMDSCLFIYYYLSCWQRNRDVLNAHILRPRHLTLLTLHLGVEL